MEEIASASIIRSRWQNKILLILSFTSTKDTTSKTSVIFQPVATKNRQLPSITMAVDGKRVAVEGDSEDRISGLPRNIKERIVELLPVRDAARTSILSQKWRSIWVALPNLVLDYYFYCNFKTDSKFKKAVDGILLQHKGDIVKFDLDARGARLTSLETIDRWVNNVTRNCVKELTLRSYFIYKLPSSIFYCSTLTNLKLCKCAFKPPNTFIGFQNLITLHLEETTFVPTTSFCVINAPRLANLTLNWCHHTKYLNFVSPELKSLYIVNCHYLMLDCFINCKNISLLKLEYNILVDNLKTLGYNPTRSPLEKLLLSLTALELLLLDSFFLELLSAHIVPDGLPFTLNCLRRLFLNVDFGKMGPISSALQLIQNSPNLSELKILVCSSTNNTEAVSKYLDIPSRLERPLGKLEYVAINDFERSKAELLFVKLLLSRTPSLLRMCIGQGTDVDIDTALELMRFPRASPRAELFYARKVMTTKLICNLRV